MFRVKCKLCAFINTTIGTWIAYTHKRMQLWHAQNTSIYNMYASILYQRQKNKHASFQFFEL